MIMNSSPYQHHNHSHDNTQQHFIDMPRQGVQAQIDLRLLQQDQGERVSSSYRITIQTQIITFVTYMIHTQRYINIGHQYHHLPANAHLLKCCYSDSLDHCIGSLAHWIRRRMSAESAVAGGLSPARQIFIWIQLWVMVLVMLMTVVMMVMRRQVNFWFRLDLYSFTHNYSRWND